MEPSTLDVPTAVHPTRERGDAGAALSYVSCKCFLLVRFLLKLVTLSLLCCVLFVCINCYLFYLKCFNLLC